MEQQAEVTHAGDKESDRPFRTQYRVFHAAFAQFCYTGSQVAIAGYFINYITETRGQTSSALGAKFLAIAQGCFAIGRFSGSCRSRNCASITQRGNIGLAMLNMTLFFESVCFPTIVALGIRGIGRHTKRGAGWIVGGVVGGACVPPILARVADARDSTAFAMIIPVIFFILAYTYALSVNFVPVYRDAVDKTGDFGAGNLDEEKSSKTKESLDNEKGSTLIKD
ncbi:hypothetical protein C0993_011141 [Termitomyces sp. T159_Od127]|nr:hypothetical protein C0993_011141 [Termitomyces sp. T159_Od127]